MHTGIGFLDRYRERMAREAGMRKSRAGGDPRFAYFRRKVLEHLEALEGKENVGKALLAAGDLLKGGFPVGTIRVWKGKKYVKVAPGKWKPQSEGGTRKADSGKKGYAARLREKFTKATNAYIGKSIRNASTGIVAVFTKESQKEIRSNLTNSKANGFSVAEHFEAAGRIISLFKTATLENVHGDTKHGEKDVKIERFLSKEIIFKSGKKARVCITVKHSLDKNGRTIYSIEAMDIKNALEKTRAKGQPSNGINDGLSNTSTVPQSGKSVKKSWWCWFDQDGRLWFRKSAFRTAGRG